MMETRPSRLLAAGLRRLADVLDPKRPPPDAPQTPGPDSPGAFSADRPQAPEHWLARLEGAGLSTAAYRTARNPPGQQNVRDGRPRRQASPGADMTRARPRRGTAPQQDTALGPEGPSEAAALTAGGQPHEAAQAGGTGAGGDRDGTAPHPTATAPVLRLGLPERPGLRRRPYPAPDPPVPATPAQEASPAGPKAGIDLSRDGSEPHGTPQPDPNVIGAAVAEDQPRPPPAGRLLLNPGRRPQAAAAPGAGSRRPVAVFLPANSSSDSPRTGPWDAGGNAAVVRRAPLERGPATAAHPAQPAAALPAQALPAQALPAPANRPPRQASPTPTQARPGSRSGSRQPSGVAAVPPMPAAATRQPPAGPDLASAAEVPPWPELPAGNRAAMPELAGQAPGQWLDALARASRLAAEQGAR